MQNSLTISQLGEKVGLPPKTIRFYEEIGLITKPKRAANGYRVYTSELIDELILIKNARELGLPIVEIKKLMVGCEKNNCEHTRHYLQNEITNYLEVLKNKIQQMEHLKQQLTRLKQSITNNCDTTSCNLLGQLTKLPKGGEENGL